MLNGFRFKRDAGMAQPQSLSNCQVRTNNSGSVTPTNSNLSPSYPGASRGNMPSLPLPPTPQMSQNPQTGTLGRSGSASNIHSSNATTNQNNQNLGTIQFGQQSQLTNSNVSK